MECPFTPFHMFDIGVKLRKSGIFEELLDCYMDPCRTKERHLGKVIEGVSLVGGSFKRKHYYLVKMLVTQVCPTFCDPMDRAMRFSRASSRPRDQPQVSCTASRFFTNWATREVPLSEKRDSDTSLFRLPGATQDAAKLLDRVLLISYLFIRNLTLLQ